MTSNKYLTEIPKTYTVSYYNPETDQNITLIQDQLKAIINLGEFKVINQGKAYQSWKVSADNPTYGPMAGSFANERFTDLKIPCLSEGCGNNTVAINWVHSSCGANFEISNEARIKCKRCEITSHVKNFSFKCSKHSGDYYASSETSINAFQRALSASLSSGEMDENIVMELLMYLRNNSW